MLITQANELLGSNPHAFEEGTMILPNGWGLVAARTEMPGVTGEMIKWWFGYIETTEQYKVWHPTDHIWSGWKGERGTGRYIGGTHLIVEKLGTEQVHKLKLNFREPSTILDTDRFATAGVSAAIYGRGGPKNLPIWSAHVLHLIHDTPEGCVMRSRFWLGDISPAIPVLSGLIRKDMISKEALAGVFKHCKEEMAILATFLPELYWKHQQA